METNNNKEKKRAIPLFWWFGGALLGSGLIVLAVLLANKSSQVNNLKDKLNEKETVFLKEKDSLSNELWLVKNNYDTLKTDYNNMNADLARSHKSNNLLASANLSNTQNINKFKNENALLQDSLDKYSGEKEQLHVIIGSLNKQIEGMRTQMQESEETKTMQAEIINDRNEKIKSDSVSMAEDSLLRKADDVSGYVNITDFGGAFGLNVVSVPYSKYFYSLSTINGYVINKRFLTGIGLGLNAYNGGVTAPVYLDFRYNLKTSGYIPYVSADGGFLIIFDDLKEPGLFINPGIGIYRIFSNSFAINLGSGLFIQRSPVKASFINFKIGIIFFGKKDK